MANPVLDELERWQSIYDWFNNHNGPVIKWSAEQKKVEGFLRHMIASTNIATTQPSTPETKQ